MSTQINEAKTEEPIYEEIKSRTNSRHKNETIMNT